MNNKKELLPHRLLFDCECLLQELGEKYPDSLLSIFSSLTEIKKEYELYERRENEIPKVRPSIIYESLALDLED